MDQIEAAILATLSYSDIFDYPLTKAELWKYLVAEKPISFKKFETTIAKSVLLKKKDAFFFLPGRGTIVTTRLMRRKISKKKQEKAKKIITFLSNIPTIEFIGISGSLAIENTDEKADIDLFLITKPNTLWITRFIVLLFLQLKKVRRRRTDRTASNTVCVNMLIDTNHLAFPLQRQDIYTARELVQLKPVFTRGFIYEELMKKNKWVKTYLPHAFPFAFLPKKITYRKKTSWLQILEKIAQTLQVWYMGRVRTKEVIQNGFVAFHPFDYRKEVLLAWEKRKEKYGIPV